MLFVEIFNQNHVFQLNAHKLISKLLAVLKIKSMQNLKKVRANLCYKRSAGCNADLKLSKL